MNGGSERVAERLASMTREEKLRLVSGRSDPAGTATGYLPGVERLDVPPFRLVDGPLGIRAEGERATAFPASIAVAATFDPDLAREKGAAMAREARALEQDALLAPGANLIRVPHCGRNFEYYSEEPLLAAETAAGAVDGIQDEDVVATVKHYVANNQETDRVRVSSEVDERTLRKLYLRPFWAAVEAGAGSVMTAYNRVNGTYMSDHDRLVGDVLKGEWGFDGYVVSDWYGTESTVGAANAGLDLEMPGVAIDGGFGGDGDGDKEDGSFDAADLEGEATEIMGGLPDGTKGDLFGDPLADAIDAGEVPAERLDDMVRRILGQLERIGRLESADDGDRGADDARSDGDDDDGAGAIDTPAHRDLAERIAVRGTVLLENDGVLPLEDEADVAVVGPNVHEAKLGGGGSSETTPFRSTSPAAGLESRADGAVTVARGCEPIPDLSLFDALPFVESEESDEPAADARVGIDADEPAIDAAVRAAGDADVAVVFVRDRTTEGRTGTRCGCPADRTNSSRQLPTRPRRRSSWSGRAAPSNSRGARRSTPSSRPGIPDRLTARRSRRCCTATAIRPVACRSRSPRKGRTRRPMSTDTPGSTTKRTTRRDCSSATATSTENRSTQSRPTRSVTDTPTPTSRTATRRSSTTGRSASPSRTSPIGTGARWCRRTSGPPSRPRSSGRLENSPASSRSPSPPVRCGRSTSTSRIGRSDGTTLPTAG